MKSSKPVKQRQAVRPATLIATLFLAIAPNAYGESDKALDPEKFAAFTARKCMQEISMMSAADNKSADEQQVFCQCVGDRRAEYLMEKPEWAGKSHWRTKTYSRAIVTCSK